MAHFTHPTSILLLISAYCQAHVWDTRLAIPLYLGLSIACLVRQRKGAPVNTLQQTVALIFAFALFGLFSNAELRTVHSSIFLGSNVLYIYQLMHTLSAQNLRTRQWCVFSSLILIGMGTQVVVNVSAIPVLLLTLILLPKALAELENERLNAAKAYLAPTYRLGGLGILIIILLSGVFWIFFPRFGAVHSSMISSVGGGPLHDEIDSSESVDGPGSEAMIFRIEGENIGYLKTKAFDEFDGTVWRRSRWNQVKLRNWDLPQPEGAIKRQVIVNNRRALGIDLPTDGYVHVVWGSTLQQGVLTGDGAVHVSSALRHEPTYYYWTTLEAEPKPLQERDHKRHLELPTTSPELRAWLENVLGDNREPVAQIEMLTQTFRNDFTYRLGAPDLNRGAPVDDLILNAKEGHCERFASAMAVLLRMRGIPARVAIGYVAKEKNQFGDFYNVRAKHAHAWTEAWYDGRWYIVDGTPFGTSDVGEQRQLALSLYEWMQHIWVSKIVEFDREDQDETLRSLYSSAVAVSAVAFDRVPLRWILLISVALYMLWQLRRFEGWRLPLWRRKEPVVEAQHFYGDLLRILRKQGLRRAPAETPFQFLGRLQKQEHPAASDIAQVTQTFCNVAYGGQDLEPAEHRGVRSAIDRIRRTKPAKN